MLSKSAHPWEDPRVTRTRNLLLEAFSELLPEEGFQSLTVQRITERAGVNRATFYAHFPDKYALLDLSIQQMFHHELEKRMFNACDYTEANLRALIIAVCEFVSSVYARCPSVESQYESLVETQVKNQLQDLLQNWLRQIDAATDPELASTAASWAIYGLVLHWVRDRSASRLPADRFADRVLPLIGANLRLAQSV